MSFVSSVEQIHALDPNRLISQYGHTVWRTDNGFVPASSLITQTADGYIWIGSNTNLWRFDGVQFVPWQRPNSSEPLSTINSVFGARDGSLWIGMVAGVARLKDGQFTTYTKASDHFGISDIIEDRAGNLWMTRYMTHGEGGICQIAGQGLRCYGKSEGFPATYGLGMTEDRAGNLWVAGGGKLFCWRPGAKASEYLGALNQPRVQDVAADQSGDIWASLNAAGPNAGVRLFHNGAWTDYAADGVKTSSLLSNTLFVDKAGALWIGTNDGLYRIWKGTVDHFSKYDGLSGQSINSVFEDREGNLWVSTDNGIDLFRNTPVITYSMDQGLRSQSALTVLALKDGSVWAGDYNSDSSVGEERASVLQAGPNRRFSLGPKVPGKIEAMFQDQSGVLWLSFGDFMAVYRNGRVEPVLGRDGKRFNSSEITAIVQDSTGSILAVNQTSVVRLRDHFVTDVIPLPKHLATSGFLAVNPSGGVWIVGQREGVMLYKDGVIQDFALPRSKQSIRIRAAIADVADPLLLGTTIGLLRWDGKRWQMLDEDKGLPCMRTLGLIKDRHGSLWIQADCGLLKAEASDLQRWRQNPESRLSFTVFNALDGAETGTIRVVQPTMALAPDGRVWFANARKIGVIDPDNVYPNPLLPFAHVEQLIADGKSFVPTGEPRIPPNPRNVEIDYTALSYTLPQRVQFRYFLEGHDKGWQGPVTRRQAFYTDLTPGTYRFHVIACNNSGLWNETDALAEFVVEPTFYQTLWFKVAVALAIAGLLWSLYLLRLKQATAFVQRRLLAQMEERERIARELHDTLLQGFQGIALQVQGVAKRMAAEHPLRETMEEVLDRADEVLQEGRERVRDLRQRTANEDELPARLTKCGQKLAEGHDASFRLAIIGTPVLLESTAQDEAYRICAEALTNAFRHASASQIEVEITYDASELRISVRDDGAGIDRAVLANGQPGHWGLTGMRERANAIRAEFKIWSRERAGTEVVLLIPATIAYPRKQKSIPNAEPASPASEMRGL